jgi:hypothetical protein
VEQARKVEQSSLKPLLGMTSEWPTLLQLEKMWEVREIRVGTSSLTVLLRLLVFYLLAEVFLLKQLLSLLVVVLPS